LLVVAGLVIDGGNILAARRTAINEADAAARAGAQALTPNALRSHTTEVTLDSSLAQQRVKAYLASTGHEATVDVVGNRVVVDVTYTQPLSLLGIAGMRPVTIRGHGEALAVRGITTGGD
jgi:Flp pilus assembly protein TadG